MSVSKDDDNLDSDQPGAADDSGPALTYDELVQKCRTTDEKLQQYVDRVARIQADSENTQRRIERDVANAHKYGLEKFANDLLPIMDSLELCIANESNPEAAEPHSILEGVMLTLKMFKTTFDKFGIKEINPLNQAFDPEHQQAISMQVDASVKPNTVTAVLQKGYSLNERLLRPALVVVSKSA